MASLVNTTGAADVIRGADPAGGKIYYIQAEITVSASVRVFLESDMDNQDTAGVISSTASTIEVQKGAENERVFAFLEGISEDGVIGSWLGAGVSENISYGTTAPAVEDRVTSKGNGKVKQAVTLGDTGAGAQATGDGYVLHLDTTNTLVKLRWPA